MRSSRIADSWYTLCMRFYNDYFKHVPKDDFGWSGTWNREINKWLEYIYTIDPTFYSINKKRVLSDKQRDEFLGEAKTIYFLGKILGLKITELEPNGNGNTKLDLAINDLQNTPWKTEVKSPSWKGQIWKNPTLSNAQKTARTSQQKYINGEGGWFSSEEEIEYAVEDSIKNALPKFNKGESNMLVIVPDMHHQILTMLGVSEMIGGSKTIQNELFLQDTDQLISTVLILEPVLFSADSKITYTHKFVTITQKIGLPVIAECI